MASNSNIDQVINSIRGAINFAVEDLTVDMEQIVEKHINSDVYGAYTPTEYKRQKYLIDSLQSDVDNTGTQATITVEHNEEKMMYYSLVDNPNQEPLENRGAVTEWIENGQIHPLSGGGFSYLSERPYKENSKEEVQEKIEVLFARKLLKYL